MAAIGKRPAAAGRFFTIRLLRRSAARRPPSPLERREARASCRARLVPAASSPEAMNIGAVAKAGGLGQLNLPTYNER